MIAPIITHSDTHLLLHDPKALVEKYAHLVEVQIDTFVLAKRFIHPEVASIFDRVKNRLLIELQKLPHRKHRLKGSVKNITQLFILDICKDIEDEQLLAAQSPHLVIKYQYLILGIVHKFVNSGKLEEQDKEDALQMVNEQLLKKMERGKLQSFRGDTLFKQFFVIVITNTLRDVLRSMRASTRYEQSTDLTAAANQKNAPTTTIDLKPNVEIHIIALATILKLFPRTERNKLEFSLQVLYCMLLTMAAIRSHYPNCSDDLLVEILSEFGKPYGDINKGELFRLLSIFLTELESAKKAIKVDALRKWFLKYRGMIWLNLFKQNIPSAHTKTVDAYFEILVHRHFEKN